MNQKADSSDLNYQATPLTVKLSSPYQPRPQQLAIHKNLQRFNVLVLHRRFGKTVLVINQLIRDLLTCPLDRPRGAYICPLHKQAKQVAWDYCKLYAGFLPGIKINESELRIDFPEQNDARLQLQGADNPDSLRGIYLDTVALDEVAQMSPRLWDEIIRPALSDRIGKAYFIGTPFGRANTFYEHYERAAGRRGWFRCLMTADQTQIIDPQELEDARAEMEPDKFEQEFMCSWSAAVKGAYYAQAIDELEKRGQVRDLPYDPQIPVVTSWDLGINDSTAIWFLQIFGPEIRVIDYREFTNSGLTDIVGELRKLPYVYQDHIAPHDIRVRELGSGVSRYETMRGLGVQMSVAKNLPIIDGINAVRQILPRCWFDTKKCQVGLEALRMYRSEYDDQKRVTSLRPVHDWTSHAADAFRYFAVESNKARQGDLWGGEVDYSRLNKGVI